MKSLVESIFGLTESIFDKSLVNRELPIEVKERYIKRLTTLLDKYSVPYERREDWRPWGGKMDSESVVCSGPGVIFNNVMEDNKGQQYKLRVFFHPSFSVKTEPDSMESLWKGYEPDLWFQLLEKDDNVVAPRLAAKFNKWAKVNKLQYEGLPLSDEEDFDDYLKALEHAIVTFQSDAFQDRISLLVDRYLRIGKPIPLQDIKRLADKL